MHMDTVGKSDGDTRRLFEMEKKSNKCTSLWYIKKETYWVESKRTLTKKKNQNKSVNIVSGGADILYRWFI